jgi:hypothetical protein
LSALPFKYRIVADKSAGSKYKSHLDFGDRVAFYAKNHGEAMALVDEISRTSNVYSVGEVGLEDAYVYIQSQRKNSALPTSSVESPHPLEGIIQNRE